MPKKVTVAQAEVEKVIEPRVFTEAELFYITEKARTQSAVDIANVLKCSVDDVSPHIPTQAPVSNPNGSMMSNLMGRGSKSGKRAGMAVMTQTASEFSDATRQNRINPEGTVVQGRQVDCIHKPLG